MSKKRSPGDGSGSAAQPRCGQVAVGIERDRAARAGAARRGRAARPSLRHLELGLVAEALDAHVGHAADRGARGQGGEGAAGGDADVGELAGLVAAHAGDEGEVVVGAAAVLAHVGPAADAAVVDGIGIGGDAGLGVVGALDERLEAGLQRAVVGGVVGEREGVRLAVAGDDVHLLAARRPAGARPARSRRTSGGGRRPSPGGRAWRRRPRRTTRRGAGSGGRPGGGSRRGRASRRGRRWPGR